MTDPNTPLPLGRILAALKTLADLATGTILGAGAAELAQIVSDAMNTAATDTFDAAAARIVVEDKTELGQLRAIAHKLAPYAAPEILADLAMQALDRMIADLAELEAESDKRLGRPEFEVIASAILAHIIRNPRDMCGAYDLGVFKFEAYTHTGPDCTAF